MSKKVNLFWFRRDLRLEDNVGFYKALSGKFPVLPVFIFDTEILDRLPKDDARVTFIFETVQELRTKLQNNDSSIAKYQGKPVEVFKQIISDFEVQNVITNRDYEPYALKRDTEIEELLSEKDIGFYTFKDQVIFEKDEVVKDDGDPYVVYTPYSKKWLEKFKASKHAKTHDTSEKLKNLYPHSRLPNLTLGDLGFKKSAIEVAPYDISEKTIEHYQNIRNFPANPEGTSHISPHLRFGTVSIRSLVKKAIEAKNNTYLKELVWREFFMQILWHFPETVDKAFKPKYDRMEWRNNEEEFEAWKEGKTGYPFVDAGMRQLNETGYMHNRVRMIVASFLCKHLLIDWRWGEAYFAEKLLDYEQSSNVGNWQWAAGSGVDAAPYFRIFNPTTQIEKFDKEQEYITSWIPEIDTKKYPDPIVNHKDARERCLERYKSALNN
ncbi:DNA photolyase family protein [Aureisphaera sp. CAU 1614]|uniref:DNA photolyase family protein n=1 Tax=Halomarinibacterium sedimenti TaxID=2857106 RepID=A0A9X1FNB3_9FLAO|nr:deoxyribodipyrimidine photo-lyase [Halomarinibacterium sedimenti]MBW2937500.1 DNA photolyase family protein [Halomarinibacterium sedimenti]